MKKKLTIINLMILLLLIITLAGCGKDSFEYVDTKKTDGYEHDGYAIITKYTGNKKTIDIPEMIDNKPVYGVTGNFFYWAMEDNKKIGHIPDDVIVGIFSPYVFDYYKCEKENGIIYFRDRVVNIDDNEVGTELIFREGIKSITYSASSHWEE